MISDQVDLNSCYVREALLQCESSVLDHQFSEGAGGRGHRQRDFDAVSDVRGAAHKAEVNDIDTEFWIHDLLKRMQDVFIANPSVLLLQNASSARMALDGQNSL